MAHIFDSPVKSKNLKPRGVINNPIVYYSKDELYGDKRDFVTQN